MKYQEQAKPAVESVNGSLVLSALSMLTTAIWSKSMLINLFILCIHGKYTLMYPCNDWVLHVCKILTKNVFFFNWALCMVETLGLPLLESDLHFFFYRILEVQRILFLRTGT